MIIFISITKDEFRYLSFKGAHNDINRRPFTRRTSAIYHELAGRKPNIAVSDIVRRFSVSEVTARHDLISLESEGKLRRVRGGAVSLSRSNAISYPEERINIQVEAKEAIAATAATLVDDGDVLVIDIGTTGFYFTKALMDKREITIITGDLAIANYASFNLPNASVVLLGGSVRKGHLSISRAR